MGPRSAPSRQDPQPPGRSVSQVGPCTQADEQRRGQEAWAGREGSANHPEGSVLEAAAGPARRDGRLESGVCCGPPSRLHTALLLPHAVSPQDPSFILQEKGLDFDACSCVARVMGGGEGQRPGSGASVPLPHPSRLVRMRAGLWVLSRDRRGLLSQNKEVKQPAVAAHHSASRHVVPGGLHIECERPYPSARSAGQE